MIAPADAFQAKISILNRSLFFEEKKKNVPSPGNGDAYSIFSQVSGKENLGRCQHGCSLQLDSRKELENPIH